MATALYFPFARCLDEIALKQAVLLYDEVLFVDPVSPQARDALYVHEARAADVDPRITRAWREAATHYERLAAEGIVRTVDARGLVDGARADALVAGGLAADEQASEIFHGRRRWQMLAARVPPSALDGRFAPRPGPDGWFGDQVVELPYWVGSSVALTYALAACHEAGAVPLTDSIAHHGLLLRRLARAGEYEQLPGLRAQPPSPYRRQQIALRVIDELAPAHALRAMSFDELIVYRAHSAQARRELSDWIDELNRKAYSQPWDEDLEHELRAIAAQAAQIAAQPGRWGAAVAAARGTLSPGQMITDALGMVSLPTLAAFVIPHVSLVGALAVGGAVAGKSVLSASAAAIDAFVASQPAEKNAVAYLLGAGRR